MLAVISVAKEVMSALMTLIGIVNETQRTLYQGGLAILRPRGSVLGSGAICTSEIRIRVQTSAKSPWCWSLLHRLNAYLTRSHSFASSTFHHTLSYRTASNVFSHRRQSEPILHEPLSQPQPLVRRRQRARGRLGLHRRTGEIDCLWDPRDMLDGVFRGVVGPVFQAIRGSLIIRGWTLTIHMLEGLHPSWRRIS